jgi:hypothetical protein
MRPGDYHAEREPLKPQESLITVFNLVVQMIKTVNLILLSSEIDIR